MSDLQSVFKRIQETKQEQRELRKMYRDELSNLHEYQEVLDKIEALRQRKKQIEAGIKESAAGNFKKLDALRMHAKTDAELLSDMAMNKLMAGETVEITDGDSQKYEPVFTVRFKKA